MSLAMPPPPARVVTTLLASAGAGRQARLVTRRMWRRSNIAAESFG